jgi:hypothetical protein
MIMGNVVKVGEVMNIITVTTAITNSRPLSITHNHPLFITRNRLFVITNNRPFSITRNHNSIQPIVFAYLGNLS